MIAAAKSSAYLRDLYQAEVAYVGNSLRRMGANPSDLEDLTQEVFVRALQNIKRYDPSRPVRPWLFGVAFRVLSEARREERLAQPIEERTPDPGLTPEQSAEVLQKKAMVLRALDTLSVDQRAVFVMHELNDHAMSEIAEALGIPLFTAYSRLRVARVRFTLSVRRLDKEDLMGRRSP